MNQQEILEFMHKKLKNDQIHYREFIAKVKRNIDTQEDWIDTGSISTGFCGMLAVMTAHQTITAIQGNQTLAIIRKHLDKCQPELEQRGFWWAPRDYDSRIECIDNIINP